MTFEQWMATFEEASACLGHPVYDDARALAEDAWNAARSQALEEAARAADPTLRELAELGYSGERVGIAVNVAVFIQRRIRALTTPASPEETR